MSESQADESEGEYALRRGQSSRTVRVLVLDTDSLEGFHVVNHQPAFLYHSVLNVIMEDLHIQRNKTYAEETLYQRDSPVSLCEMRAKLPCRSGCEELGEVPCDSINIGVIPWL